MKELIKIQSELKAPKSKQNAFGGFRYRSAEDILEAVKPMLAQYGCLLTLSDEVVLVGERYFLRASATFIAPDGKQITVSAFAAHSFDKKGMDLPQMSGSASSYARKYALSGLFLLDDEKDPDSTPMPHVTTPRTPPPGPPPPIQARPMPPRTPVIPAAARSAARPAQGKQ